MNVREQVERIIEDCKAVDPEGDNALECVINGIGMLDIPDNERPHFILLTQDDCDMCDYAKASLSDMLAEGQITEVDINSPEGLEIAQRNDLPFTPTLALLDSENNALLELHGGSEED